MKKIITFLIINNIIFFNFAADTDHGYQKYLEKCHNVSKFFFKYLSANQIKIVHKYNCVSFEDWKNNNNLLHYYTLINDTDGVKGLLELGDVNIDFQDEIFRETALMIASYKGNKNIVELLINAGAKVNIRNFNSSTAIDFAIMKKHKKIIKMLKKAREIFIINSFF